MKPVVIFSSVVIAALFSVAFFRSDLWSKTVTESEAKVAATRQFLHTCDAIKASPEDFETPCPAHVSGGSVRYSYIWYSKRGDRPIVVSVLSDGWTEASFGVVSGPKPTAILKTKNRPNQALEPTTTAVTDRASHAPRQPPSWLIFNVRQK
jgi:hypothetical protein